jgi:hypothetical protein
MNIKSVYNDRFIATAAATAAAATATATATATVVVFTRFCCVSKEFKMECSSRLGNLIKDLRRLQLMH